MSLFKDTSLGAENPQSREEDEEIEEQKRRQEELADLLATGIHAFNYDDSTMNSSLNSIEAVERNSQDIVKNENNFNYEDSRKNSLNNTSTLLSDDIQQKYKDSKQQEQLQVLYDVRVREINNLRNEFNNYQDEKEKEIKLLKNKVTLSEAEIRHLQITLSNSESLLVEKNDIVKSLKEQINCRDSDIENLKKLVEEQNLEICTYKSVVNELQLKLVDNNPFNADNRKLNSEELQKAHQTQIIKMETLLQEHIKTTEILKKEKNKLEEDIRKLIDYKNENEKENNLTIMALSKKIQTTQQQCKDLYLLGEAIKKESDHFKERLEQVESNKLNFADIDSFQLKNMDKDTMIVQLEKLKRMLLDKDIELNTLKSKLKFYDSDLSELFEYREILNKMHSCEAKPCNNIEHEELIIFMQKQLQSYQQAIEDRNNQIINLNVLNKELQEKIEETIQQTRTDIQKISQKYSLPQLETMNRELKHAEEMIIGLKQELVEKEEVIKNLQQNVQENEIQQVIEKKRINWEQELASLKQELVQKENEKQNLVDDLVEYKKTESQLSEENERVKTQLQKICLKLGLSEADIFESDGEVHELKSLKSRYGQIHDQLQHVLVHLETMNVKRANFNIVITLKKQMQNFFNLLNEQNLDQKIFQDKLEQWDNMLSDFMESLKHSDNGVNGNEKNQLDEKIIELTNIKQRLENDKISLQNQLKTTAHQLEETKTEIKALKDKYNNLKIVSEDNKRTIQILSDKTNNLSKCLEIVEQNKLELEKQLENTQKQLNSARQESIELHKEVREVGENSIRKKLFQDLENVSADIGNNSGVVDENVFQKCLQAELLKKELALRELLQTENIEKMQRIENQYKKVITEKTEFYNKEKDKWKHLEGSYRKQFAEILEECGKRMQCLENENVALTKKITNLVEEYKVFKTKAIHDVEKHHKVAVTCKRTVEDLNKKWAQILQDYMLNFAKIEKSRRKAANNLVKKIAVNETERNIIESLYDDKIRKMEAEKAKRTNSAYALYG